PGGVRDGCAEAGGPGARDVQAPASAARSSARVCLIVTRIAGMLARQLPRRSGFAVTFRSPMDESRIQEIVDRVIARIGELPDTPMEAVKNPPAGYVQPPPAARAEAPARHREVDIPRGRRG